MSGENESKQSWRGNYRVLVRSKFNQLQVEIGGRELEENWKGFDCLVPFKKLGSVEKSLKKCVQ